MDQAQKTVHLNELESSLRQLVVRHQTLERDRRRIRAERRELDAEIVRGLAEYLRESGETPGSPQALSYATEVLGFTEGVALRRLRAASAANVAPEILAHLRSGRLTFTAIEILGADVTSDAALKLALGRPCRELGLALAELRGSPKSPAIGATAHGNGVLRPERVAPVNENREPVDSHQCSVDADKLEADDLPLICSCCASGVDRDVPTRAGKKTFADVESTTQLGSKTRTSRPSRFSKLNGAERLLGRFRLGVRRLAIGAPLKILLRLANRELSQACEDGRSEAHAVLGSANFVRRRETGTSPSGLGCARGANVVAEA